MESLTFHVITPYKGPQHWLDECIASVKDQTIAAIHHVIVDDLNKGACRNHFEALQTIEPLSSNIVVHLDGDDFFLRRDALEIIARSYQNPNTWATYGNYVSTQGSVCRPMDNRSFRESIVNGGWPWSHPRTFRAHLIPHLKESDMKDQQGAWYSSAPDVAVFLPILELCGQSRVEFIKEILLYYRIHANNEHSSSVKLQDQFRCAISIFQRQPYSSL